MSAQTPEQKARRNIDRMLRQCGWIVQSRAEMNITAAPGVAIAEFPLNPGFADYMLYTDGKAIGIVEAKPEGHTLTGVETQSARYTSGFPENLPRWQLPLPFAYESTDVVTQFTNALDPNPRSREVFTFHRPEELLRLLGNQRAKLDEILKHISKLDTERAELFATVYAAWNDLLIDGRPAAEDSIVCAVHSWHVSKQRFTADRIRKCIKWMKDEGYVPTGTGRHSLALDGVDELEQS